MQWKNYEIRQTLKAHASWAQQKQKHNDLIANESYWLDCKKEKVIVENAIEN